MTPAARTLKPTALTSSILVCEPGDPRAEAIVGIVVGYDPDGRLVLVPSGLDGLSDAQRQKLCEEARRFIDLVAASPAGMVH